MSSDVLTSNPGPVLTLAVRIAGCGFAEAVAKLAALGADLNARDITQCTPLQNAAHGTYSALSASAPPPLPSAAKGGRAAGAAAASASGERHPGDPLEGAPLWRILRERA